MPLFVDCAMVKAEVRSYKDPGYSRLGVYGGGPESYFDYQLFKIDLKESVPNKVEFWKSLKELSERAPKKQLHNIFVIYCGERTDRLEDAKKRVDAWLQPEPMAPTYPELIPAICIGEENVSSRDKVLDGLARHIRETYHIPVFQWYSDPLIPNPNLTADGWIWDSYNRDEVSFRKHLQKFAAFKKTAICMPWATDPHWPQWAQYPTTEALINREWHQFRTCCEFNISCAVFSVGGAGNVNAWLDSQTKEMVILRNWLRNKRLEMHSYHPGQLPLPSANFSARDSAVQAGGDSTSPSVYQENFDGFDWLRDADVRGFTDLQLTSRPEKPGFLQTIAVNNRRAHTSLVYRFESYFPLKSVKVSLAGAAPIEAKCINTLAIGIDELETNWPLHVNQKGNDEIRLLTLQDDKIVKGQHVFYVRIEMQNDADQDGLAGNRLDQFRVECIHQSPPKDAAGKLIADEYGSLSYSDDFALPRWQHLGELNVSHKKSGGYGKDGFWVSGVKGTTASTHLLQRFSTEEPIKQLYIDVNCFADEPNLGGSVSLQLAPRGQAPQWTVTTHGVHQGRLRLEVSGDELQTLTDFDLHITLKSKSGVDSNMQPCAKVESIQLVGSNQAATKQ